MSKIALVTDTHFGARNDCQIFDSFFARFYKDVFFPTLKKENITNIIHLGDIMDRRKYVNYLTARSVRTNFLEPCYNNGINTHIIIGNHDTFYKNTNEFNSMNELAQAFKDKIKWYDEPTDIKIDNTKIALLPWINPSNHDKCIKFINSTNSNILFAHLELAGFGMYKGVINEHGMDSSIFDRFSFVASGHFHHKSSKRNIHYLGSPYEITWSDYDDSRGFHIFDSDDLTLQYIVNPYTIFEKLFYNDNEFTEKDLEDMDFSHLKNKILKVVEIEKNNPHLFDRVIDKIEKSGVLELQVVQDHKHQDIIEEEEIIDENADTFSIINDFIDSRKIKNSNNIKKIMTEIYTEALQK